MKIKGFRINIAQYTESNQNFQHAQHTTQLVYIVFDCWRIPKQAVYIILVHLQFGCQSAHRK